MSVSRSLGSLVVRIVAQGLGAYKAEMNALGDATEKAASKIDKSAKAAGAAAAQMGGGVAQAADAAQALTTGAGVAGVGVAAFAVILGAATYAAYKGAQEQIGYQKALTLSGNVAGTTSGQVADMARIIGQSVGTQYQAAAALTALAGTGQVAGSSLQKFGTVAVQMQQAMGVSVQDTAKQFAELGQEPVKASLKLNESMHYLTASTFEQIKAAQNLGDAEKAASLAQGAYADAMAERSAQVLENLGYLETAWKGLWGTVTKTWDAMLGGGREKTIQQKIDALKEGISEARSSGSGADNTGKLLAALEAELAYMQRMDASQRSMAVHMADRVKREEASIALSEKADKFASNQVKMQREIAQAKGIFENSNKSTSDTANYAASVIGIQKRYEANPAKAKRPGITEADKGEKAYADIMAKETGFAANFTETMLSLVAARDKNNWSTEKYNEVVNLYLANQPGAVALAKSEAEAIAAIEKARNSAALAHAKELESLNGKAQTLEDEVAMYGMSKTAIEELTIARMLDRIEVLKGFDNSAEAIAMIEQEIAARRRLAKAGSVLDDRKDAEKASKEAEKETKKIADTLHNDVKNALSNAFRDTKNPIAAFGDALGNVIFTRVTNSLADAMATQLLNNGMVKGFMSLFGFADGGSFDQGGVQAFANGGAFHNSVLTQPTPFKFASGGSFAQGIAGEVEPEAVMPLTRTPDGRLGVQSSGEAKPVKKINVTVNYNMNVGDIASVSMVKQAVAGSERRISAGIGRSLSYGGALS